MNDVQYFYGLGAGYKIQIEFTNVEFSCITNIALKKFKFALNFHFIPPLPMRN